MADTAARLVDHVLPKVPIRQWVLTLPYPLRYRCAWNARLTSEDLQSFLRAVFADQRRRARKQLGIHRGQCGSVTFIQRFGSALNLTPHFHTLVLDGVYAGPSSDPGPFSPLPPPETEDVARVLAGTARRILRRLERKGIAFDDDPLVGDDPLMAMLGAASIRSRIATGPEAGERWRRLGDRVEAAADEDDGVEPDATVPPRCVRHGGMSLHADVAVPARDRNRLERLCRYVARPPLALTRLEAMPDGRLAYRFKTRWRDGTTHVVMERHELLERLTPLIPPPRAHQVRYHGVLAPCASGRDRVVPASKDRIETCRSARTSGTLETHRVAPLSPVVEGGARFSRASSDPVSDLATADQDPARRCPLPEPPTMRSPQSISPRRLPWAELLQRVFEIDALRCPRCGGRMRVLSAITDANAAGAILRCLALPARAPPLAAPNDGARSFGFGAVESFTEAPAFDFDQSVEIESAESSF
jgi:hypothetical protein